MLAFVTQVVDFNHQTSVLMNDPPIGDSLNVSYYTNMIVDKLCKAQ